MEPRLQMWPLAVDAGNNRVQAVTLSSSWDEPVGSLWNWKASANS